MGEARLRLVDAHLGTLRHLVNLDQILKSAATQPEFRRPLPTRVPAGGRVGAERLHGRRSRAPTGGRPDGTAPRPGGAAPAARDVAAAARPRRGASVLPR